MEIMLIILAVMWLFSYVKFRKRYKMDKMMCEFTHQLYNEDSDVLTDKFVDVFNSSFLT